MLAAALGIITVAAAAQAVTGFGFAMLAVPLLATVMPVNAAVVVGSLASLAMSVGTAIRERAHVHWRTSFVIFAIAVIGMPLGLYLLVSLPAAALTALVGIAVLGSTWLVWRRPTLPEGPATIGAIGFLVGVLTTSTGTNGPPLVAAFQSFGYDKRAFRATIASTFVCCGIVSVGFFAYGHEISATVIETCLVGIPGGFAGWWAGDRFFRRLNAAAFRVVVLIALTAAALLTLIRALI
ncbi:MAG TPA: sulfite exporter TauE/SafE family protein [Micromonosporaceae bacterium]|nr:sulfite exporter TauE/SafE family protein [Micromonosporaceae bacterium]